MPAATTFSKWEKALAELYIPEHYAEATHLCLLLNFYPLAGQLGNVPLRTPRITWHNAAFDLADARVLQGFFSTDDEAEMPAAFAFLSQVCEAWEQENAILRNTATALLRYVPHDAELYRHLRTLLTLLLQFRQETADTAETAAFLKEYLYTRRLERRFDERSTPACLCRLFRALVPQLPARGDFPTVYDPCCGKGNLTAAMVQNTDNAVCGKDIAAMAEPYFNIHNLLAGNLHPQFLTGNSVTEPPALSPTELQTFDVVVSHPPFGYNAEGLTDLENDPYKRFFRGLPRRNSGDWLHICNALAHAEPQHGLVMMLVTQASLFRVDISVDIRSALLRENLLDAVIALPAALIPNTVLAPVLLVFRHGRSRRGVRFINAMALGDKNRSITVLTERDIERISLAYAADAEEIGFARTVEAEEIAANEHIWDARRYVRDRQEAEQVSPEQLKEEIDALRAELADKRRRLEWLLQRL